VDAPEGEALLERLPGEGRDGAARRRALAAADEERGQPTTLVGYRSSGRVLVIGPEPSAREQAARLAGRLPCAVLALGAAPEGLVDGGDGAEAVPVCRGRLLALSGHLGRFAVTVGVGDDQIELARALGYRDGCFDLVLDLQREPALRHELLPPGYFAPRRDPEALERALAELPELVGEFDKPRYLRLDPELCAHAGSGIEGCRRCLDACPSGAIRSAGSHVEVDSHLCHGAASCASACPSGAIRYVFPATEALLATLRAVLARYREAGGEHPLVLLHGAEAGTAWLRERAATLPGHVIPWQLEEAPAAGLEAWLALLAYGAGAVVVLADSGVAPSARAELERQRGYAVALLEALGYPGAAVRLLDEQAGEDWSAPLELATPATFAPGDGKRRILHQALDHLHGCAARRPAEVALPAGAPLGALAIEASACTLCMGCVAVCPAAALEAGGGDLRLLFVEQRCVQCALCVRACPEGALALVPRLLLDPAARRERRLLHEDRPLACVACGKPFAGRRLIERMRERLAGHAMFREPEALRRLEMCEDCRVRDLLRDGGGMLDR